MINIEGIKEYNSYIKIEKVEYKKDKIVFYYREKWNKTFKRLPFVRYGENNYILDLSKHPHNVIIHCKEEEIVDKINEHHFDMLALMYESVKAHEAKTKKKQKNLERKGKLLKIVKQGSIVERYGRTPNLGLKYIKVDEISDYGVSGFYLEHNGDRSNEYTTVSWDYIKCRVEEIEKYLQKPPTISRNDRIYPNKWSLRNDKNRSK